MSRLSLAEKVLYRGWLPVDDELDDTSEEDLRLHLEALAVVVRTVTPASQTLEALCTILTSLQALASGHQAAHWQSAGEAFYGDHLMYQRLYDAVSKEIDDVAERYLGLGGDASAVGPNRLLAAAAACSKDLITPGDLAASMMMAEQKFVRSIETVLASMANCMSPGVSNLLQDICDRHQTHVYLLSRRCNCATTPAPTGA
jgi:DNA-binding ferritin-like protein